MPAGTCKLCKSDADIKLSHFIPKFVGKWVKETSATGYIRSNNKINKRAQDIIKDYWLCESCEQLFSGWEREFANKIFYPFVSKGESEARYGSWLSKFCASLSWRTMTYVRSQNVVRSDRVSQTLDEAERALSSYLLGKSTNLGKYEQHLYPLEGISETSFAGAPPNLNRYLLRTMQMDLLETDKNSMVYTKLPGFMLLGLTGHEESSRMRSSRVALAEGRLSPRAYFWPTGFAGYLFDKVRSIEETYSGMDKMQKDKITQSILDNPERFMASKTFEAFQYDFDMFGSKAFSKPKGS
ncbi:hypothetical protein AHFPHNDE_01132 [Pseudomonas sp. MM227]|uniref:hypothetical protein n=1 Tax=Pseudomonas sp. MM227 TaxID=3019968 RepID=UPI002220BC9C|nr:hypothetical protein [Pseudomonas sp. MM227]CAI3787468.1 hypothetical protein AHFPHNDE_01132 [Pseudomonas sp. MM227]